MVKLTICRVGETIEVNIYPFGEMKSSRVYSYKRLNPKSNKPETILYRPYYRREIDGVLNVFAEEELEVDNME